MNASHPRLDEALLEAASKLAEHLLERPDLTARILTPAEWARLGAAEGEAWTVRVQGTLTGRLDLLVPRRADGDDGLGDALGEVLTESVHTMALAVGHLVPERARPVEVGSVARPAGDRPQRVAAVVADEGLLVALALTEEVAEEAVDPGQTPAAFRPLAQAAPFAQVDPRRLHLLRDVEMGISVELGRTRMTVREVLSLAPGVVLELDRAAGSPVDVLVNGTLLARGEVVVVDDEFAVRVTEVVGPDLEGRLVV